MGRTRVRWLRATATALAVVAVTWFGPGALAGDEPRSTDGDRRVHVVRAGETLWEIAVAVVGPTADPRPLVDAIEDVNGLDGIIFPGQRLVIPAP